MSEVHMKGQAAARGSRLLKVGLVVLGIGVAAAGYMLVSMWGLFSGLIFNPAHPVPGSFEQELDEGSYLLSVQTSSSSSVGPFYVSRGQAIDVTEVVVSGPDGTVLDTRSGRNQSVNRNGDGFSGVVVFDVNEAGTHEFRVVTSSETSALITQSLSAFSLRVFGVAALGGITLPLGLLLSIIGFVQRRKPETPSVPPPGPWEPPPPSGPSVPPPPPM
ncbi:MAG: hypothetical protein AAGA65_13880 [Actinomycetota bacterium]